MQREDYQRYNRYKWVLWPVILSFVVWGAGSLGNSDIRTMAARVGGREISRDQFIEAYRRQYELYQQFAQNNPSILEGLPQQIINALVDQELMLILAENHGITASPQEIADEIRRAPIFLDDSGAFVGTDRYKATLRDRLRTTATDYEAAIQEDIIRRKFREMVQDVHIVSEADAREEYENTLTVRFDYVRTNPSKFASEVAITEEGLKALYEEQKDSYGLPEQRNIQFVYLRPDDLQDDVEVSEEEVLEKYEAGRETTYQEEEERRARHILFKVEGQDEESKAAQMASIRPIAEDVLARVRAGEDFAALAQEYSQDTASAEKGGDLGFFPRGRMVGPFEESAFSLSAGETSDLVETQFGLHIIQLMEVREGGTKPLESVRAEIERELRRPKALELALSRAEQLARRAATQGLEAAAQSLSLEVSDSGFFGADDPVPSIGLSDDLAAAAFSASVGTSSQAIPITPPFARFQGGADLPPQGYVVFSLLESRPPHVPPFEEVRAKVEADLRDKLSRELADQEILSIVSSTADAGTLEAWASAFDTFGYVPQDSGTIGPRANLAAIPDSNPVVRKAWSAVPGSKGHEVIGPGDAVFYWVKEKQAFDDAEFAAQKQDLLERLGSQRRGAVLQSILDGARESYEVEINFDLIQEFQTS